MSEEKITAPSPSDEEEKKLIQQKSKRMLTVYAIVFLAVVLCLLIASFWMQKREYRNLESELQTETEKSTGIAAKYDTILSDLELLKKERDTLKTEKEALEEKYASIEEYEKGLAEGEDVAEALLNAEKREQMLTRLAKLYRTYRNSNRAACHEVIAEMEKNADATLMTEEEKTDYEALKKKVKYIENTANSAE